ncbi:MAG: hypothetical protein FWE06_07495 [Oscillospiraceae bacterium]|nr:hypothetical protein [Oscillospiraceae bacterium]
MMSNPPQRQFPAPKAPPQAPVAPQVNPQQFGQTPQVVQPRGYAAPRPQAAAVPQQPGQASQMPLPHFSQPAEPRQAPPVQPVPSVSAAPQQYAQRSSGTVAPQVQQQIPQVPQQPLPQHPPLPQGRSALPKMPPQPPQNPQPDASQATVGQQFDFGRSPLAQEFPAVESVQYPHLPEVAQLSLFEAGNQPTPVQLPVDDTAGQTVAVPWEQYTPHSQQATVPQEVNASAAEHDFGFSYQPQETEAQDNGQSDRIEKELDMFVESSSLSRSVMRKVVRIISTTLFYAVMLTAVFVGALAVMANNPTMVLFGYRFNVMTESAEPSLVDGAIDAGLRQGNLIVLRALTTPQQAQTVRDGSIVAYRPPTAPGEAVDPNVQAVHRVTGVTRGEDGSALEFTLDAQGEGGSQLVVAVSNVVGLSVAEIPHLGAFVDWIMSNWLVAILIVVVAMALLIILKTLLKESRYKRLVVAQA